MDMALADDLLANEGSVSERYRRDFFCPFAEMPNAWWDTSFQVMKDFIDRRCHVPTVE